jgi:hypothetical protein
MLGGVMLQVGPEHFAFPTQLLNFEQHVVERWLICPSESGQSHGGVVQLAC